MSKLAQTPRPEQAARFWRLPAVMAYTQRSRAAIYQDPNFPKRVKLGPHTTAWVADEVKAWCKAREEGRNGIAEPAGGVGQPSAHVAQQTESDGRLRGFILRDHFSSERSFRGQVVNDMCASLGIVSAADFLARKAELRAACLAVRGFGEAGARLHIDTNDEQFFLDWIDSSLEASLQAERDSARDELLRVVSRRNKTDATYEEFKRALLAAARRFVAAHSGT